MTKAGTPSTALAQRRIEARWVLRERLHGEAVVPRFPAVVAEVLAARGIATRPEADAFYKPHEAAPHDPYLLPDFEPAVVRVRRAIDDGELIALYGDFDVDGVTSLAVLTHGLDPLGANTTRYIPERYGEGYGLNTGAIDRLIERGATLLITADCGISSVEEVEHANGRGLDVIIIDHHSVPEVMPAAVACVNPKRSDSQYPFSEMAAVGVAFRFLEGLYDALGREFPREQLIDLVALGTVVDVAPLIDENRAIVAEGLARMREAPRPGVLALAEVAGIRPGDITAESLGFALGPRLNAAGRLEHANTALELVMAPDLLAARPVAQHLQELNLRRREQTDRAVAMALELAGEAPDPLIMVGAPEISAGIVGLVAARLAEQHHRPAIVYQQEETESRASARSIPAFDVVGAIRKERHLLKRHGGHRAAAGFTVANEHLDELRDRLVNTAAELLGPEDLQPEVMIDAEIVMSDLRGLDIRGLMRFEPCGHSNPRPVLLSRNVQVVQARPIGSDGAHLRLRLKDGPLTWPAVAFRRSEAELADRIDVVYTLKPGLQRETVEFEVLDVAPSAVGKPVEIERG